MANLKNTKINDTGFLQIPTGSSVQRPSTPTNGEIRYNSELKYVEQYDVEYGLWFPAGFIPPIATGGTVTDITQGGVDYRVHTFTSDGTFEVARGGEVEYLVVAGGGGGGQDRGGGAGGGGIVSVPALAVTPQQYPVNVGGGGIGGISRDFGEAAATNGGDSAVFGLTAIGGGRGGYFAIAAGNGGSGGGAGGSGGSQPIGLGTAGQGNNGGNRNSNRGGGGGGFAQVGGNASSSSNRGGNGGNGSSFDITGTPVFYGGGGGGGNGLGGVGGSAGLGGGGKGGAPNEDGEDAEPNTGGGAGGGGRGTNRNNGGAGGSGIVVIRYRIS